MENMTWRELRDAINELGEDKLDEKASVWLDDLHYMEYGTAGSWPCVFDGTFITIDTDDYEDDDYFEED